MKPFNVIILITIISLTGKCNNESKAEDLMEVTGKIEKIEMTSWQYGTHTLSNEKEFYALRSEKINLDDHIGKEITVSAKRIEGYPVDGGPEFLQVEKVKE